MAMGERIAAPIPTGKQFDWEALLTTNPEEFVSKVEPWISARSKIQIPDQWLNGEPGFSLSEIFNTKRKMIMILDSN